MVSFDFAGALGTYLLHVPPSYAGEPTALVINLHGAPGTGAIEEMSTGMSPVADARGFVVAYPDGGFAWHSAPNFGGPRDDVAFIGALIDHVGETMCIDLARVYATGHSAGGWMVYRLACDLSDRLAAVAPVAGGFLFDPAMCAPARAVPLMHFHGTVDPRVPYDAKSTAMGPPGAMLTPGVESVAKWAEITGCDAEPTTTFEKSDWTCLGYGGCAGGADVTLCSIEGMGHPWPGGDPGAGFGPIGVAIVGPASMTLNASEYMWDALFSRHSL
jgi:polyhydroxybutyrate depolymerase